LIQRGGAGNANHVITPRFLVITFIIFSALPLRRITFEPTERVTWQKKSLFNRLKAIRPRAGTAKKERGNVHG